MQRVSPGPVFRGAFLVLLTLIPLAVAADEPNPPDPPGIRIMPPGGAASPGANASTAAVTTASRGHPPVADRKDGIKTTESRVVEWWWSWLKARIGVPVG